MKRQIECFLINFERKLKNDQKFKKKGENLKNRKENVNNDKLANLSLQIILEKMLNIYGINETSSVTYSCNSKKIFCFHYVEKKLISRVQLPWSISVSLIKSRRHLIKFRRTVNQYLRADIKYVLQVFFAGPSVTTE